MTPKKQLALNVFIAPTGHHIAAWRHPHSAANGGVDIDHYIAIAQAAEAAKFDAVFVADYMFSYEQKDADFASRSAFAAYLEPLTLLSALAVFTKQIGLIGTQTTTFNEPYNLARRHASLDLISHGRAGWNLVTTGNEPEAFNFGDKPLPPHAERYERAREFAQVVKGLWDSWEENAFPRDKASGRFFNPEKLHVLNHHGKYYNVRGPLNVARSPQGRPVIVQAGSSPIGRSFAAEFGEVLFVAAPTLAEAQVFYNDVKAQAAGFGRGPDDIKVLPGLFPVVGRTEEEAQRKYQELQDLIQPEVGLRLLSGLIGADLTGLDPNSKLPELPQALGHVGRQKLLLDLAVREGLTIKELYLRIAGARGHLTLVGTPEKIADELELWLNSSAADGFNVMPPIFPTGLTDFIELVLPELRRRGLFRTEYTASTLRGHLGLRVPTPTWARQAQAAE
ncbi:MAG TPA: LLM class flavin-dependent oxidoreductase [Acidocella sp.]|nr:LLM class flavin-dependent oxidoreductase [Acidocella sp.]